VPLPEDPVVEVPPDDPPLELPLPEDPLLLEPVPPDVPL
jgi:hypothetical protein